MQKKILASLLVTPMAFTAMANIDMGTINYDKTSWNATGLVGDALIIDETGKSVTASVGSGVLTQTLKGLTQGKYKITFSSAENTKISVSGDNVEVTSEDNTKSIEFTLGAKGDVVLKIEATNASNPFSFAGGSIEIVYDFTAQNAALQAELLKFKNQIQRLDDENKSEYAEDLRTRMRALYEEFNTIKAQIDELQEPGSLDVYNKYELYATPNKLETLVADYGTKVADLNKEVTAENNAYKIKTANEAAKAGLLAGVTTLEENLKAVTDELNAEGVAEYVHQQCDADAAKIAEDIAAYKAAIETAYADLTKEGIEFESKQAELQTAIDELSAKLTKAKENAEAWAGMNDLEAQLTKAYQAAQIAITGFAGINDDYANVFAANQAAWMNAIAKQKDDAMALLKATKEDEAAEKAEANKKAVNDAIDAINQAVADAQALVDAQNDAMTTAQGAIKTVEDDFAAKTDAFEAAAASLTLPEDVTTEYNAKVKAISDAIAAVKTTVDGKYKANELTASDYESELAAINVLIADLQTFIDNNNLGIKADAQNALNGLKDYIEKESEGLGVNILDKFNNENGTIPSIQAAIDAMTPETQQNVMDAITKAQDNADALIAAVKGAKEAYDLFHEAIADLTKAADKKVKSLIKGEGAYDPATGIEQTIKEFNEKDTAWKSAYDAAAAAPAQDCFNQATALAEEINGYQWETKVVAAFNTMLNDATQGNYDVVANMLAAVKADAAEGEYTNKGSVDFTEIDATMAKILSDLNAAKAENADDKENGEAKADACGAVDEALQEAMKAVKALQTEVTNLKNNQKAYDELLPLLNGEDGVQASIDALAEFNGETSLAGAKTYFAGQINGELTGEEKSLQQQYNALKGDLDAQLKAGTVATNKANLQTSIDALKEQIANMKARIIANEEAHEAQLQKSQDARKVITDILAQIQEGTDATLAAEWVDQLTDLRDNDLMNLDREVTQSYGKGESATAKTNDGISYINAYDAIIEAANKVLTGFTGDDGYAAKVAQNNAEVVAEANWTGTLSNLRAQYNDAILDFNKYKQIDNAGYRAYLETNNVFKTHEALYDYAKKIRDLDTFETEYVQNANTDKVVLTGEKFAEDITKQATDMAAEMQAKVQAMVDGFNTAGENYYAQQHPVAEGEINEAKAKIAAVGLTDEDAEKLLAKANEYLDKAETAYTAATADEVEVDGEMVPNPNKNIGLAMDDIADDLDMVGTSIDLQTAAEELWNSEYAAAVELFDALDTELAGYEDADPTVKATQQKQLKTAREYAATLNGVVNGVKEGLIDTLKGALDGLESYKQAAKDAVAAVKASDEAAVAEKDAAKEYNDVVIPGLNTDFDALCKFVNALGGASTIDLDAVKAVVDNVQTKVNLYRGALVANETEITAAITAATNKIAQTYADAEVLEINYLKTVLVPQVKVAYNNASVGDKLTAEELATYNDDINKVIDAVDALALDPEKTTEFQDAAVGYEKQLSQWIVELQQNSTEPDNALADALYALGEKAGEVKQAIKDSKGTLAGYEQSVQDEYAGQYDKLKAAVEAIEGEYAAAGSDVIAQQANYMKRLDALKAQIAELDQKAADADVVAKQKVVNDTVYASLMADYDKVKADLESLKQRIENYNLVNSYQSTINYIENSLNTTLEDINAKHDANELTADYVPLYSVEYLTSYIDRYELNVTRAYARNQASLANNELMAVGNIDASKVVPAVMAEINGELAKLSARYTTLINDINSFRIVSPYEGLDIMEGYVTEAQNIKAAATALLDKAAANSFIPGVLNGGTAPSVSDVQILINMIGEGMTYDELYAENPALACAADLTGDKVLNVADVTAIITAALNDNTMTASAFAMQRGVVQSNGSIDAVLIGEENGVRRYAINLTNSEAFAAGQFDLQVAAGSEIVSVEAADRLNGHDMYTFDNVAGTRVVFASMQNAVMSGNEGATVIVEVRGKGGVKVENAIFADENSKAYSVSPIPGTTGVDSIYEGAKAVKEAIYDAAGRAMQRIQRGINIIRHSDGTVTKELHK